MTVLTEKNHVGEFLLSQANGYRSIEEGAPAAALTALAASGKVVSGTVVQLTAGAYTPVVDAATDPVAVLCTEIGEGETLTKVTVVQRDAEVAKDLLTWPSAFLTADINEAIVRLEAQGIKVVE